LWKEFKTVRNDQKRDGPSVSLDGMNVEQALTALLSIPNPQATKPKVKRKVKSPEKLA
jgi:hypothetical protein